jgi:hypothetical protein
MGTSTKRTFNSFRIEYGITNPQGKDLVRIDFFLGEEKAGQALFGDAISPGAFASLTNEGQVQLFFPISHFQNITTHPPQPACWVGTVCRRLPTAGRRGPSRRPDDKCVINGHSSLYGFLSHTIARLGERYEEDRLV